MRQSPKNILVCIGHQSSANIEGACHEIITKSTALRLVRFTNQVDVLGDLVLFSRVRPRTLIQRLRASTQLSLM